MGTEPLTESINELETCYLPHSQVHNASTAIFLHPVWNLTSPLTSLSPRFPVRQENFGKSWTFEAHVGSFMFAWILRTFWSKMGVFRGKIGEGVVWYWPPMNLFFLTFRVITSVPNLVKIGQEMQPWECGHMDRQTNWFYKLICPMF